MNIGSRIILMLSPYCVPLYFAFDHYLETKIDFVRVFNGYQF